MEKKQKVDDTMSKDIISELPTNLIESILERLSINEAVRTSILSKKWRYIWTSLPNLVLNKAFFLGITPNKRENADQYCRIIDRILVVHSGPIQNFVVYIPFAENDIDLWMLILLRNQLKGLIIHNDGNLRSLKLPSSLYSCHQLTHLLLNNCEFNPPLAFSGFSNLKQLILSGISISPHTGLLISTLPSLLTLNLRSCTGIENFKSIPPILKDFSLCKSAEVLWQYLHAKTNISLLLVTVGKKVKNAKQFKLTTFLANLPKLVTLVLDGFSLKLLAAGISPKLYSSDKLTNIMLGQIRFSDLNQVSCVLCLLRSCPNLRKLQINCAAVLKDDITQHDLDNLEATTKLDISLNQLRLVTLTFFNGLKAELLFVKLILAHSSMLQQLIIHTRKDMVAEEELKISRQLMRFHRASMLSDLIFEQFNNSDNRFSVEDFRK